MIDLPKGKANIVLGGQWGSEGKGNVLSMIGYSSRIDIAVSHCAVQAGHTFYDRNGQKRVTFHLPISGVINEHATIILSAHAGIDPDALIAECAEHDVDPERVYIDPCAAVVSQKHKDEEADTGSPQAKIASTAKGVGAAYADRVRRNPEAVAGQCAKLWDAGFSIARPSSVVQGLTTLVEMPQGYELSLTGRWYPHVTSRDINVAAALAYSHLHPSDLGHVTMVMRAHPIRVGNTEHGYSGDVYTDSHELSWEDLGVESEITTVTKRVRRVFSFSALGYQAALKANRPDLVAVMFCDYLKKAGGGWALLNALDAAEGGAGVHPQRMYGYGPLHTDILRLRPEAN